MLRAWVCLLLVLVMLPSGNLAAARWIDHTACDHHAAPVASAGHHDEAVVGHDHDGDPAGTHGSGHGEAKDACHATSAACPLCGVVAQSVALRVSPLEHWSPTPALLGAIAPPVHQRPPIAA